MAQSKHEIQSFLAHAGSQPRHRFGQNFMIDQNLVRLVADAGTLADTDIAIEVGPGTGTLTDELLQRAGRVVACEIDRDLARTLREKYAGDEKFALVEGDALAGKHAVNEELLKAVGPHALSDGTAKLVANLPYNIASPLVIELLIAGVATLAFTVQKEVGDRLRAPAGGDDYGPLSVMAQLLGKVEILRTLPPQAFWPAPKIDSALVRVTRLDVATRLIAPEHAHAIGRFVHKVFSFRRKTLRKALSEAGCDSAVVLSATGYDGTVRPEELTPEQFVRMYDVGKDEFEANRAGR